MKLRKLFTSCSPKFDGIFDKIAFFTFFAAKELWSVFFQKKSDKKFYFCLIPDLIFHDKTLDKNLLNFVFLRKRKLAWFSFTKLNQHSKSPFHSFLLDFVSFVSKSFPPNSKISTSAFWTNLNQGKNIWGLSFHARLVDIQTSWHLEWRGTDDVNDEQCFLCKKKETPFPGKTTI